MQTDKEKDESLDAAVKAGLLVERPAIEVAVEALEQVALEMPQIGHLVRTMAKRLRKFATGRGLHIIPK